MNSIAVGATVRQKQPAPINGVVTDISVDQESLRKDPLNPIVLALVEWEEPVEGEDPVRHSKHFKLDDLEAT